MYNVKKKKKKEKAETNWLTSCEQFVALGLIHKSQDLSKIQVISGL